MRKIVETTEAPSAISAYSQAVITEGGFIFTSGQIGLNPQSGELVEGGIEAETERTMNNLKAVLDAAGSSFNRVIKITIYLASLDDYATVNKIYSRFFSDKLPARATVQVAGLPKGALVEIDCIATLK